MQFKIGDNAIYPSHGLAKIVGLEAKEVAGHQVECYVLNIVSSGAKVMVPVAGCNRTGVRSVISSQEIDSVLSVIKKPVKISHRAWNRRFREFNEKMRTGSVCDVAEVFRDLWSLQSTKSLSYGEKKMLEKSKDLVVAEISAAKNVATEVVESEIEQMLAQ